jgi:prophage regulatory protein
MATSARLLRQQAVIDKVSQGRSTLWKLIKEGKPPQPVKIGARSIGWVEAEVDAYSERLIRAHRGGRPDEGA